MNAIDIEAIDWAKGGGLVPAIVQHADSGVVLMLGYMNRPALEATLASGRVTFFSRSRARLWVKGETSGNAVLIEHITADCDRDTLLVRGRPLGPVCHTGAATCFGTAEVADAGLGFLAGLEAIIADRLRDPPPGSYTGTLQAAGMGRMAQKVGEEGLEVALAAVSRDDAAVIDESADLLFHLMVLLQARGQSLGDVVGRLAARHRPSGGPGGR